MARTAAESGAGYQLEYWVGAYYLAAMLGSGHPQGGVGQVTRVTFQRGSLGDVVVHGEAPGGTALLDLQVKRQLSVSAEHGDFAKVVRQMHERVDGQPLNRGRDKYGIAVIHRSQQLARLRELGDRARHHVSADDFFGTSAALNANESGVLRVVMDVIGTLDGVQDVEHETWRVLGSGLVVLELPVDEETGGPRSSLRSWIDCRVSDPVRNRAIEDALFQISAEHDRHGGSLDRQALETELLSRGHRLTQDASAPVAIVLESMTPVRTDEVLAAIPEGEADRVSVDVRPHVRTEDKAVVDPSSAVAEVLGDERPLKAMLSAQEDRSLVLAGRAHIPLAALVGYLVTDRGRVRVLDWHPDVGDESWSWPNGDNTAYPDLDVRTAGEGPRAAVLFSLSFAVGTLAEMSPPRSVTDAVGQPDVVVRLTHPDLLSRPTLRARAVRSARQARAYGQAFRDVLDQLTNSVEGVDVFYAGPLSVAFELGRSVTGTFHPPVRVWNFADRRYGWGVELNPPASNDGFRDPRSVAS